MIKRLFLAFLVLLALSSLGYSQSSSHGNITESYATCASTNACVKLHLPSSVGLIPASVTVTLTGTFTATLEFEQSADNGVTWTGATGTPQPSGTASTATTSTGVWVFDVASRTDFRIRGSAYTSGTAGVFIQSSPAQLSSGTGVGGISSLDGLTVSTQLFSTGVTDPACFTINPDIDTHEFSILSADVTHCGLLTAGAQGIEGNKTLFGSTLIDNSLHVTGNFSTDHPIEVTGEACGTSEANVGLYGFDPVTGLPCYSYDGSAPASLFPRLDQVLDPTADKTFAMGAHSLALTGFTTGSFTSGVALTDLSADVQASFLPSNLLANKSNNAYGVPNLALFQSDSTDVGAGGYVAGLYALGVGTSTTDSLGGVIGLQAEGWVDSTSTKDVAEVTGGAFGAFLNGTGRLPLVTGIHIYSNSGSQFPDVDSRLEIDNVSIYNRIGYAIRSGFGFVQHGDRLTVKSNSAIIQNQIFTGAGLNDATSGGTFTGTDDVAYCVQIDASVPSPDTFEWGTGGSCSNGATGVGITGAAQNLSNGVQITFAAIDGHTIGNNWTFTAFAPIPLTLQDHNGNITAKAKETGDWHSRRYFADTGTALVAGDFTTAGWQTGSGGLGTITGTDQAFQFTMTATDPNITLNPTVTLTFHDGTWTTAPVFVCSQNGGTGAQSFITVVPTATQAVITYLGTPVTTLTYIISCVGMGI